MRLILPEDLSGVFSVMPLSSPVPQTSCSIMAFKKVKEDGSLNLLR